MPSQVTLTITEGNLKGQKFTFNTRTTRIIGRAKDCDPQIPDDENHRTISRYHCLLDINPPDIRVRDFGSKNGTFVNGKKIGQRSANQTPEAAAKLSFPEVDLKTGDEIKLSHTIFKVKTEIDPELEKTLKPDIPLNQHKKPDLRQMIQGFLQQLAAENQNLGTIKNYKILRELGRGGFSIVYLAQHKQTGEQVALKVMLPQAAANQRAINWFMREIDNTKYLRHPNVIQLKDSGHAEGVFFFTAVPVRDRNSSIPKPLADVIDLALVDNPEIYFKSAGEFKQALLKNCPQFV